MSIFSKILSSALFVAFLVSASFASNGVYDRDLVRGFLSLKSGFYSMNSNGIKLINYATGASDYGASYNKGHLGAQVEIGAEYNNLRTWFDINFMPITQTKTITPDDSDKYGTKWYSYGVTWMWGYKLLQQNSIFNIIPAVGPGVELINVRGGGNDNRMAENARVVSSFGPALNIELELRLQFPQFSAGIYGGYKVVRFDAWDVLSQSEARPWPSNGDVNADKVFVGLKLSWTMLNNFQKREKDLQ